MAELYCASESLRWRRIVTIVSISTTSVVLLIVFLGFLLGCHRSTFEGGFHGRKGSRWYERALNTVGRSLESRDRL